MDREMRRPVFGAGTVVAALCLALAVFLSAAEGYAASKVIYVKAGNDWNVTADDMEALRVLAGGVGWEFEPKQEMDEALKRIGMRRFRCINVAPFPGSFDDEGNFILGEHSRLDAHFRTCRAVGASPHVVMATWGGHNIGVAMVPESVVTDQGVDWGRYRNYCKAVFRHVLIDNDFPEAAFEVGNEADIRETKNGKGSRANYESYFDTYKRIAEAAQEFEAENPGHHVTLGGPALAWAFTFRFGDFNWTERFLRDVGRENVKLDFIGLHFYGNISALDGDPSGAYPAFSRMMQMTRQWRDSYAPGVPICMTEWGASYHTNNSPTAVINGNNVGAAFAAAFLNQMLKEGVGRAIYLVSTDLRQQQDGKWVTVWGWPSLFVNPNVLGVHTKAPYHTFQMLAQMAPKRIEATTPGEGIDCIASRDDEGRLTLLVWNYNRAVQEGGPGVEAGRHRAVTVRVLDASDVWKGPVHYRRWLVSESVSNAYHLSVTGQALDERCDLQQVGEGTVRIVDGMLDVGFGMPPSSVSLIELVPADSDSGSD